MDTQFCSQEVCLHFNSRSFGPYQRYLKLENNVHWWVETHRPVQSDETATPTVAVGVDRGVSLEITLV